MQDKTIEKLVEYTRQLMAKSTAEYPAWNIELHRRGGKNTWNYIDGCMISAILALYDITGDEAFFEFADRFCDWFVQEDGSIRNYTPEDCDIDSIRSGVNLFKLYDLTGKEKYRRAMDTQRYQLEIHPRTKEGSFWHKKKYPWQVWLDGLYMGQPFYFAYEKRFNEGKGCTDSFEQFMRVRKYMRDAKTGLYYHGYDESRQMFWANPETGLSQSFWLRAMGWFFIAIADVAELMGPDMEAEKAQLGEMQGELAEALLNFQHESGMFYQVVNRPQDEAKGNYLETSGTMLIATGMLRGARLGLLDKQFIDVAKKAFYSTADRYLELYDDGTLELGGICIMGNLGAGNHQNGTPEYYYSEPIVKNEAKGVAPMLLACTELLRL